MERLFEDPYLIVLNKPAGLQTEPDPHGYPSLLEEVRSYLESTRKKRPVYIQAVHRLDRPASGVVLFALKPSALKALHKQFAERRVNKTYLAITHNRPESDSGTLTQFLYKDSKNHRAIVKDLAFRDAREVRLDYELAGQYDKLFYWKISLHTGKYHQIRAQFAYIGCPILGDNQYGSTHAYRPDAIALHAVQLDFNHPVSEERLHIVAPKPDDPYWSKLA